MTTAAAATPSLETCRTGSARSPKQGFAARSILVGVLAALVLAGFYVAVVRGASGSWDHLRDQVRADWYLLVPITVGFGTQAALLTELRRRHRMQTAAATAGGAGAGASAAGMIACCAHHLADLAPFLGASGAAAFLYDYRVAFIVIGLGINAVGVAIAAGRLHRTPLVSSPPKVG